jgi:hypothetical protein
MGERRESSGGGQSGAPRDGVVIDGRSARGPRDALPSSSSKGVAFLDGDPFGSSLLKDEGQVWRKKDAVPAPPTTPPSCPHHAPQFWCGGQQREPTREQKCPRA